jgi:hypothetical protein
LIYGPRQLDSLLARMAARANRHLADLACCFMLLVELAVFHRHVLSYRGYLFPWDFRGVHWPLAAFAADSFRRGDLPLWDPYTYCGNPGYANIQSSLFYPPVLAATYIGSGMGVDALPRLLAIAAVLQMFFAGLCTYVLLRRLGLSCAAAWIGGTVYELGCFFASQAQHLGAVQSAAWLPLAWLCVLALRDGIRWRWLAGLSFALAMSVLAGLPQVAVAVFGSALILAALLSIFRLANSYLPWRVLLAWAWALALAAVQLGPSTELARNSVAKYRTEWLSGVDAIQPQAFFSLVVPNYWHVFDLSHFHGPGDPTFLYLYSGLLGLALAVAAVLWKPGRIAAAFAVLTAAAAFCMLGDWTAPGRAILSALPSDVRIGIHPEFWLCVFSLGIAILAGIGAEHFIASARMRVLVGTVAALDLLLVSSGRPFNISSLAAEPGITRNAVDGHAELVTKLRTITGGAHPPYRIDMMAGVPLNWSSSAPLLGIPTSNGCDPLALERIIQVRLSFAPGARWGTCYQVVKPDSPVLALINVRYLLAMNPVEGSSFRLADELQGYRIYENPAVLPRGFLVHRVVIARDLEEAARNLHAPDFRPSEFAIVEGLTESIEPGTGAQESVDVVSERPTEVVLRTHAAGAALLVLADSYYPGWEAQVDGRGTRVYPTDVGFRGVRVPAGDHQVRMRFAPRILYWSATFSLLVLLGSIVVVRRDR